MGKEQVSHPVLAGGRWGIMEALAACVCGLSHSSLDRDVTIGFEN